MSTIRVGENETLDSAIRRFKRKCARDGIIGDLRKRYDRYASDDGIALIDATIAESPSYWVYYDFVNESKRKVDAASDMNVLIDTTAAGLTCLYEPQPVPDIPHYDSMSQIKLGNLFAEEAAKFFD